MNKKVIRYDRRRVRAWGIVALCCAIIFGGGQFLFSMGLPVSRKAYYSVMINIVARGLWVEMHVEGENLVIELKDMEVVPERIPYNYAISLEK